MSWENILKNYILDGIDLSTNLIRGQTKVLNDIMAFYDANTTQIDENEELLDIIRKIINLNREMKEETDKMFSILKMQHGNQ